MCCVCLLYIVIHVPLMFFSSFRTELFGLRLAFETTSFEWVKREQTIASLHLGWGWVELQMFAKGSKKTGHLFGDLQFLETPLVGEATEQKEQNSYLISWAVSLFSRRIHA